LNESGSKQKSTTSATIGQTEEARGREANRRKLFEWGLEKLSTEQMQKLNRKLDEF
jgi:serine/threonine protein kinase